MFKNISLGMYFPGNSLLHRLQARTKLLVLLCIIIAILIANQRQWHFAPYIVMGALLFLGVAFSGISARVIWRRMWWLLLLAIIGALSSLLFPTSDVLAGKVLTTVGPFSAPYAQIRPPLFIAGLVMIALLISSWLPLAPLRTIWRARWLKRLRGLMILAVIAIILFLWLTSDSAPAQLFSIGPLKVTEYNVWLQVTVFTFLLVMYAFSLLLTMTTTPVALIEGVTMLLAPLRRIGLPVDDFALMTLLALRFVPTLVEEVEQLIKAQTARGADVSNGTIRERLQSLTMLFIPLMHGIFRRSAELATALEARGYEVEGQQTMLHERSLGAADYAVLIVVVLVMGGSLVL
jgi:energy-coupling factor transport system permease protein